MNPQPSRAPLVLGIIAAVLAVAVIITLAIALTRPSQTPAAVPDETEQSEPADTDAAPAPAPAASTERLVFSATGFELTTDTGTFTHAWSDEGAPAIAALTKAFGEAPVESFREGDSETYAYRVYTWDDFQFFDVALGEGNRPRAEVYAPTFASYSANDVDGVEIVGEFDISIGESAADVEAQGPDATVGQQRQFEVARDRQFHTTGTPEYAVVAYVQNSAVIAVTYGPLIVQQGGL